MPAFGRRYWFDGARLPLAVVRIRRWYLLPALFPLLGLLTVRATIAGIFRGQARIYVPLMFIPAVAMIVAIVCLRFLESRIRRRVKAMDDAACPCCTYDLRGLSDGGSCPECGTPFESASRIREAWSER